MRPYCLLLTLTVSSLFFSCDPCRYADIICHDYYSKFRVVSAINGQDLVFGPNKVYDKNQIRFYSLKGSDTTFFDFQPGLFDAGTDSCLLIDFMPQTDVAYIRLSSTDIDTLNITYVSTDLKCCESSSTIAKFRYNNLVDFPGVQETHVIKK